MSYQNPRQKGSRRDREIIHAIEECGVLNTEQVTTLFFSKIQYGQRKAQERLLKLFKRGKLQRCTSEGPYCYYLEKPGQLQHRVELNWVRIWLEKECRSWEKIHAWKYELDYGVLRADAFVAVKNCVTKKFRFMFIEMDRATNKFDKVKKYNRLYDTGRYLGDWWVGQTNRFPPILVVTTSRGRAKKIMQLAEEQNTANLEFRVRLLDDIREEVLEKCGKLQAAL